MLKKKGFTLIELLAVIVILAIIALITIPAVLKMTDNAKVNSYRRSVDLYGRSVNNAIAVYENKMIETGEKQELDLNKIESYIDYEGNDVECITTLYSDKTILITGCKIDDNEVYAEENTGYGEKNYYYYTNAKKKIKVITYIEAAEEAIKVMGIEGTCEIQADEKIKCGNEEIEVTSKLENAVEGTITVQKGKIVSYSNLVFPGKKAESSNKIVEIVDEEVTASESEENTEATNQNHQETNDNNSSNNQTNDNNSSNNQTNNNSSNNQTNDNSSNNQTNNNNSISNQIEEQPDLEEEIEDTTQNIVTPCTFVGNGSPLVMSAEYECEVKSGVKYNFYILSFENNKVNLIMNNNICEDGTPMAKGKKCNYKWYSSRSNSYGPVDAMTVVYNATKNWNNVPNIVMNHTDEGRGYDKIETKGIVTKIYGYNIEKYTARFTNLKARIPKFSELRSTGCKDFTATNPGHSCPDWIMSGLNKSGINAKDYWTIDTKYVDTNQAALLIEYGWLYGANNGITELHGIRPVISVLKSALQN